MSELFTLTAPDLAALLCSRVCHDIISPVGAINNGLELLDEGGAKITVTLDDVQTQPKFTLASSGPMLRVPPKFLELHSGRKPEEAIDAHAVQPYYTLLLAREANMAISIHANADEVVLTAV